MGEYADYEIDRMIDAGYSPFSGRQQKGRRDKVPADGYYKGKAHKKGAKKGKVAPFIVGYPSKNTPSDQLPDYPEKMFDMSFMPPPVKKVAPPSNFEPDYDSAPF